MAVPLTLSEVPDVLPYIQYVATTGQTLYPYPFPITQDSDLVVVINGITQSTDSTYTLSGQGNDTGGNVTLNTGSTAGDIITLFRNVPIERLTQIAQNSGFSSTAFNAEFNNIYLIMQQLEEAISLCLQVPNTNNPTPVTTLLPSAYANKYLSFDAHGNPTPAALTSSGVLTAALIGGLLYPQSAGEAAKSIVPTSLFYEYGWLPRYGAAIDGVTDDSLAIEKAVTVAVGGGLGFVFHPGGNCVHASQILAAGGWTLFGNDRSACVFTYTGSASTSAWRITNNGTSAPTPNTSGSGLWNMRGVKITTAVAASTAAGVEINACGYAYYNIENSHITGTFKFGLILDGTEVVNVTENILDNGSGSSTAVNLWIVDGADRTATQAAGYSNAITISGGNQFNNGLYNIADDGGSNHYIVGNNLNGAAVGAYFAAVENLTFNGNELENTGAASGSAVANILFSDQTSNVGGIGAATVGPCTSGEVRNNFLGMNMTANARAIKFTAPGAGGYHVGFTIRGNNFRNNTGNAASIDVTQLAHSECRNNYDLSTGAHYTGVHNDTDGNTLFPPVAGSACTFSQAAYLWGDTTYPHQFAGGALVVGGTKGIGYGTGVGGVATQITSRTTSVTLNKLSGQITLVSHVGSATPISFTVSNTTVAATDTISVSQASGTDLWEIFVTNVAANSFQITAFTTGGATTEQPVFNFNVIKGVTS